MEQSRERQSEAAREVKYSLPAQGSQKEAQQRPRQPTRAYRTSHALKYVLPLRKCANYCASNTSETPQEKNVGLAVHMTGKLVAVFGPRSCTAALPPTESSVSPLLSDLEHCEKVMSGIW